MIAEDLPDRDLADLVVHWPGPFKAQHPPRAQDAL
jgi:hypothetical protein